MFRLVRVPAPLDKFFRTLRPRFDWDHFDYFRLLVLVMAFAWGRRNVANLYRYLDAPHHRTRFNNFFLVQRWDPEAALRQKARDWQWAIQRLNRCDHSRKVYGPHSALFVENEWK